MLKRVPRLLASRFRLESVRTPTDPDHPTLLKAKQFPFYVSDIKPAIDKEIPVIDRPEMLEEVRFKDIPIEATIYLTKMVLRHKRHSCAISLGWKGRLCVISNFAK